MPATIRANIQRKLRQSDNSLKSAVRHLADVWYTVDEQHADVSARVLAQMKLIDHVRQLQRDLYEEYWGKTREKLWESGDLTSALVDAKVILDPKHKSRRRE
jgi:hypothetical protein